MQTNLKNYDKCNGCVNLITGTLYGDRYKTCKSGVTNPILCPRTNKVWVKEEKKIVVRKPRRKRKMKKQLYKIELRKSVAKTLKDLREEKGLSQCALERALKCHILQSAISTYERGLVLPTPERVAILAKFFKVTPEYIYGYTKERKLSFWQKISKIFKGGK